MGSGSRMSLHVPPTGQPSPVSSSSRPYPSPPHANAPRGARRPPSPSGPLRRWAPSRPQRSVETPLEHPRSTPHRSRTLRRVRRARPAFPGAAGRFGGFDPTRRSPTARAAAATEGNGGALAGSPARARSPINASVSAPAGFSTARAPLLVAPPAVGTRPTPAPRRAQRQGSDTWYCERSPPRPVPRSATLAPPTPTFRLRPPPAPLLGQSTPFQPPSPPGSGSDVPPSSGKAPPTGLPIAPRFGRSGGTRDDEWGGPRSVVDAGDVDARPTPSVSYAPVTTRGRPTRLEAPGGCDPWKPRAPLDPELVRVPTPTDPWTAKEWPRTLAGRRRSGRRSDLECGDVAVGRASTSRLRCRRTVGSPPDPAAVTRLLRLLWCTPKP